MKTTHVDETEFSKEQRQIKKVKESKSSLPFRIGAFLLWILGLGMELGAYFAFNGKFFVQNIPTLYLIVAFLVIDAVFVIIGSYCWKRANHISPASDKNSFLFWIQNNLGVIISIIAFLPIIIIMLSDKKSDKKTKTIASVVAVVLLAISGISSYDFNPISQEELTKAEQILGDTVVYWTPYGKVYHLDLDCPHLNRTAEGSEGNVHAAIEHNKTRLCKTCAAKHNITDLTLDD